MSATATFILESAAKLLGKLKPAYTLSTVEKNDALPFLNGLVQQYSTRNLFMTGVKVQRFTLVGNQQAYTIGPGGNFNTDRPTYIKNANLILTGSTPEVRVPLDIWDDDQWAATRVQAIPTTVPTAIYYDQNIDSNGRGTIFFWGEPAQTNDFEMYAPSFLTEFPDLTTAVQLQIGYQEMLITSAAERLAPTWGISNIPPMVIEQARRARAAIQSRNSEAPKLSNDAASMSSQGRRPTFNWRTGSLR